MARKRGVGLAAALLAALVLLLAPLLAPPAVAFDGDAPDLSEYALPDGTIPVICHGLDASADDEHPALIGPHCPLCTGFKFFALPAPDLVPLRLPLRAERPRLAPEPLRLAVRLPTGIGSRGPPSGA